MKKAEGKPAKTNVGCKGRKKGRGKLAKANVGCKV